MSKAVDSLITAGPVAIVLGLVLFALWQYARSLIKAAIDREKAHAAELERVRREAQERTDRLQERMLKLAVRVQRAVEALAGIELEEDDED